MPTRKKTAPSARKTNGHAAPKANGGGANGDPFLRAPKDPVVMRLPAAKYLALEGSGSPESKAFQEAIGALYGVAFTLKFTRKKAGLPDFKVLPLEGMWWTPRGPANPWADEGFDPTQWRWKLLIRVPSFVTAKELAAAKKALAEKRGDGPAKVVALERIAEGKVVQMLHVGPYAAERASIARMMARMREENLAPNGRHHEIYLGDPRRAKPEKLKTILRQPVK